MNHNTIVLTIITKNSKLILPFLLFFKLQSEVKLKNLCAQVKPITVTQAGNHIKFTVWHFLLLNDLFYRYLKTVESCLN